MQPNNVYLWNTDFHSLCNFACNQYHTCTKSDDFLELSKIHLKLKLVGYTKMERIHVLIKRNIIETKIKDISTDWDSSAISWLYWDDRDEQGFWTHNAISPFLIIKFEHIYLTCIEPILECFGFSPYLVYFSFFLFDRTLSVLKMPGYFEVNQWNWW